MITFGGDPVEHDLLCVGRSHIVDALEHSDKLLHDGGGLGTPAFLHILFCICLGSLEEEIALSPEIGHEIGATFHHAHGLGNIFGIGVGDAMFGKHRHEELGKHSIVGLPKILMIEPYTLLIVEFRATLRAMFEREFLNQVVHRHELAVVAGIPAEESEEVDNGFREITLLAIA